MISESLVHLGEKKSGIRELFEYGLRQAAIVGKENVYDDVYTLQEAACGCVRFPFNGYERHAGLLSCLRKRARH